MATGKINYHFNGEIWKDPQSSWFFVTLPKKISEEIRVNIGWQEEGWGRLKAIAKIEKTEWDTSIWFDKKSGCYLLPLKGIVRKKANLKSMDQIDVEIFV